MVLKVRIHTPARLDILHEPGRPSRAFRPEFNFDGLQDDPGDGQVRQPIEIEADGELHDYDLGGEG